MSLVEVMMGIAVITIVSISLLATLVQTRRMTELCLYQNAAVSITQGYIEQIKNVPYDTIPLSPTEGTDMTAAGYATTYFLPTQKDDVTLDPIVLSPLPVINPDNVDPDTPPTSGAYANVKVFDVNRTGDLTLHLYAWVEDRTPGGVTPTQQLKGISILYLWQFRDGARTHAFMGTVRTLRSIVPTF
jgi:hypothetical protein